MDNRVEGIEVYRTDAVVIRSGDPPHTDPPKRGEIREFSLASRRRLAFVAQNTDVHFRNMITLTYPKEFPNDGTTVKYHLHAFLTWLRRDTGGCAYLWFLEFQARGAPHIHLLYDTPYPKRNREAYTQLRARISLTWYNIVGSKDEKHLAAGTRVERIRKPDGAARYATKYAWKMKQKAVPPAYRNVGRLWGASRDVKPKCQGFINATDDDIRGELADWEYLPNDDKPLYRVLYNTANRFRRHLNRASGSGVSEDT